MKKQRWVMDGGFWDLDASTPRTLDGTAKPVPGDTLPLGLSRGTRLSRPKQIDFMQRFMAAIFVPSYAGGCGDGFSLQRVLTVPFGNNWFASLLGHFNIQKFVSSVRESRAREPPESSWLQNLGTHLRDKSFYALGFCSEFLITPEDTALVSFDLYGDEKKPRKKAVFHHKFPHHNLTLEAVSPGLFVDNSGTYWDVPSSVSVDFASLASESGASYHLCMHYNMGSPQDFDAPQAGEVPPTLLPGLCVKSAFAYKKNFDIWRSSAGKLKLVQPYDIFLSSPHISASGLVGSVVTAAVCNNSVRSQMKDHSDGFTGLSLRTGKVALLADLYASVSFTAQHGNFQRLFLDLTRLHARLDFPSGSKLLSGTTRLARDILNSQQPRLDTVEAVVPQAFLSVQQQIAGPFSFRIDSGVAVDLRNQKWNVRVDEPIYAIEYALQVLGSAKAVAWYSPKHREFMVELRFFET